MSFELLTYRAPLLAGGWQFKQLLKSSGDQRVWIDPILDGDQVTCAVRHGDGHAAAYFVVTIPTAAQAGLAALAAVDPGVPATDAAEGYAALSEVGATVHLAESPNPRADGYRLLAAARTDFDPGEPSTATTWLDDFAAAGWRGSLATGHGPQALAELSLDASFGVHSISVSTSALDHRKLRAYLSYVPDDAEAGPAIEWLAGWAGRFTVGTKRDEPFRELVKLGYPTEYTAYSGYNEKTVEL